MEKKKYTGIVVPETHWDRAWYLPFQPFRAKLVEMVDSLIELLNSNPHYKSFTFDGQTIVLEDYLQIKPEKKDELKKLVKAGRLYVGPWYILPDEFLISGEAIIRNLMLGHKIAAGFGKVMKAGYIPDPFGHISQMPQILNGFGMNDIIFTRGVGEDPEKLGSEFYWKGPDGKSKVIAIYQVHNYGNAAGLGYKVLWSDLYGAKFNMELAVEKLLKASQDLQPFARTKNLLLNNGVDHTFAQPQLPDIIDAANKKQKEIRFRHGTYMDYTREVQKAGTKLATLTGELRHGRMHPILTGVTSSRIYLLQANYRLQNLFEKWVEPLSALGELLGKEYPRGLIWQGWKYILKNHPHDDICGCSIDQVHRDMNYRNDQAQLIGDGITEEAGRHIASRIDTRCSDKEAIPLIVFNPTGRSYSGIVRDTLSILESKKTPEGFVIVDSNNSPVPHREYGKGKSFKDIGARVYDEIEVSFEVSNVPALGYKLYFLKKGKAEKPEVSSAKRMENRFYSIKINSNGTLNVTDKSSGLTYSGWNTFEDGEDAGDEYDYSPGTRHEIVTTKNTRAKIGPVKKSGLLTTCEIEIPFTLPASLGKDRKSRLRKRLKHMLKTSVTIYRNQPRIDIRTEFDNQAKDHRLRVLFPTNIKADHSYAAGQFDVVKRNIDIPETEGWNQKPLGTHPQQEFVSIDDDRRGVSLMTRGIPEYEIIRKAKGCTVALTLLRAVGWLSRADLLTRRGNAGPPIETPEAQCLGKHIFEYSILSHNGTWEKAKVWRLAQEYLTPLKIFTAEQRKGKLPRKISFLEVGPDNTVVSALKKAERSKALVLRIYNTTGKQTLASIRAYKPIKSIKPANLNEEIKKDKTLILTKDGRVRVNLRGFQIKTLLLQL